MIIYKAYCSEMHSRFYFTNEPTKEDLDVFCSREYNEDDWEIIEIFVKENNSK